MRTLKMILSMALIAAGTFSTANAFATECSAKSNVRMMDSTVKVASTATSTGTSSTVQSTSAQGTR